MAQSPTQVTPLVFKVTRHKAELVAPAKPTPNEFKLLSDIDDQQSLRFQIPTIQFYRRKTTNMIGVGGEEGDPVKVIRESLAQALVFYYPFAGRLREGPNGKLMVECNNEGVMFIEADADVTLEQFGNQLQPPFPCMEELLYDVPGSSDILNRPLLLIQVTRLTCGGFILALRLNHTVSDAAGFVQFLNTMVEMAKGACTPSVHPVWQRGLLNARHSPRVTFSHHEYDEIADDDSELDALILSNNMVQRSFFFGTAQLLAIRRFLPPYLQNCTTFELLTACIWRCRTMALQLDPHHKVRMCCLVNGRAKFNPPLPTGYYGNAFAFPAAVSTAGDLCRNQLGYALDLVRKAKSSFNEEYMKSVADLMVTTGRRHFKVAGTFILSDVTRAGFREVDFGWGEAVYGGPTGGGIDPIPVLISFLIPSRNEKGENGVVVPICLPAPTMERFVMEMNRIVKEEGQMVNGKRKLSNFPTSML